MNPLHDVHDPDPRTHWQPRDYALVAFLAAFGGTLILLVAILLAGWAR